MDAHSTQHEGERRLETGDPEGGLIELNVLLHRGVRRMVRRDGVHRPINEARPEGARARDPFIGHREVVRRDIARNGDAIGLGASHELDRPGGGEMRQMQVRSGHPRERDVARDGALLRGGGHARKSKARGDRAFVHHALRRESEVLSVLDDGPAGHARVLERTAEQMRVLHRRPVVRKGDRARRGELDHVGELAAFSATRDRGHVAHSRPVDTLATSQ